MKTTYIKKLKERFKEVEDIYNDRATRKCKDVAYWNGRHDEISQILQMFGALENEESDTEQLSEMAQIFRNSFKNKKKIPKVMSSHTYLGFNRK